MARRPSTPRELPDALRDAVERTVDATIGSAERGRASAQGALDEWGERLTKSGRSVAGALEGRRPATADDVKELKAELRRISRRLDAIEERLPAKRAPAQRKRSAQKRPAQKKG